jgi:hypothetical protein
MYATVQLIKIDAMEALLATKRSAVKSALHDTSIWFAQRCKVLSAGAESGGKPECCAQ